MQNKRLRVSGVKYTTRSCASCSNSASKNLNIYSNGAPEKSQCIQALQSVSAYQEEVMENIFGHRAVLPIW